ncbi:Uncharacterized protein Rs2_30800 [Raphanus sativus]|nr:Uncharacterized protein Rs2_30800 [Raphanus sativus]
MAALLLLWFCLSFVLLHHCRRDVCSAVQSLSVPHSLFGSRFSSVVQWACSLRPGHVLCLRSTDECVLLLPISQPVLVIGLGSRGLEASFGMLSLPSFPMWHLELHCKWRRQVQGDH